MIPPSRARFVPLEGYKPVPDAERRRRARDVFGSPRQRRTVRIFSDRPVDRFLIEDCLRAAGTAPSGANRQPWPFGVVGSPAVKRKIRAAAEAEEQAFYATKAPQAWLDALAPLGTDAQRPVLETAPYLIAIFAQSRAAPADGRKVTNDDVTVSVGIATWFLTTALHTSGLATLTHTSSPVGSLNPILGRPDNERPFHLLVTGHPAADCQVPDIGQKALDSISTFF